MSGGNLPERTHLPRAEQVAQPSQQRVAVCRAAPRRALVAASSETAPFTDPPPRPRCPHRNHCCVQASSNPGGAGGESETAGPARPYRCLPSSLRMRRCGDAAGCVCATAVRANLDDPNAASAGALELVLARRLCARAPPITARTLARTLAPVVHATCALHAVVQ